MNHSATHWGIQFPDGEVEDYKSWEKDARRSLNYYLFRGGPFDGAKLVSREVLVTAWAEA